MLQGIGCIPAGSSLPPLWSLRFFTQHVYGKGAPDGSRSAGAAARKRLDAIVRDELVLCIVLGVAAERTANRCTQVMPVEVINRLLAYDGKDEIPTHDGALSVSATPARLMRARTVSPEFHVKVRPLHFAGPLYYVPDELLESQRPARHPATTAVRSSSRPVPPAVRDREARATEVEPTAPPPTERVDSSQVERRNSPRNVPRVELRSSPDILGPRGTAPVSPSFSPPIPMVRSEVAPLSGALSREGASCTVPFGGRVPRVATPLLLDLVRSTVDLREFQEMFPHLRPILARFGDQRRSALRTVLECLSRYVRVMDPRAAKALTRGNRGGTTTELRRVRDEQGEAH